MKVDIVLCCLMLSMILIGGTLSLIAPLYPQEAEKRGVTPTQYGFVFGVFALCGFLLSVPLGLLLNTVGVKHIMISSMFLLSLSTLLFGLLNYIMDYTVFLLISILLRILGAIGQNGLNVSVYAVINEHYKDRACYLIGLTDMYFALGLVIAPPFASALFNLGDYTLPFAVTSGIILVSAALLYKKVPSHYEKKTGGSYSQLIILTYPKIWAGFFASSVSNMGLSTFLALLEPHLRQFNLSVMAVGCLFMINGATYSCMCPLSGYLCDKGYRPANIIIGGSGIAAIGAAMVGPVTFLAVSPSLPLVVCGLILHGCGLGMIIIPAYIYMKQLVGSSDYEHIVSGLFLSGLFLGGFIGPTVGGPVYDYAGFDHVSLMLFIPYIFVAVSFMVLKGKWYRPGKPKLEKQPLLPNTLFRGASVPRSSVGL